MLFSKLTSHTGSTAEKVRDRERANKHCAAVALLCAATAWGAATLLDRPRSASREEVSKRIAGGDIDDLKLTRMLKDIETPGEYETFLKTKTGYENVEFPSEFFERYRDAQDFKQRGFRGPCSNFTEVGCRWGALHGHDPYVVSLWPKDILDRLHQPWHQIGVLFPKHRKHVLVADNDHLYQAGGLDRYMKAIHPDMSIVSFGGIIPWHDHHRGLLARLISHAQFNAATPALESASDELAAVSAEDSSQSGG